MLRKTAVPLSVLGARLEAALVARPWLIATRQTEGSRLEVEAVGRPVRWLPQPQVRLEVGLDEGGDGLRAVRVETHVHRDCKRHFIVSGCAGLGVTALAFPLLLALGPGTSFLRLVRIVFAFPAAGLAGIGYAGIVEHTVTERAKQLEIEIWKALEAGPMALWRLVEDRQEDDVEKLRTTIWPGVALLGVLGLLLVGLGGAWLGLFVLALLTPPLVAVERLATLSQSLPFRYRWKSFRAMQCVSMYTFMLLPVLLLGLGSLPLLGPDLALFSPLLVVSSYALFFLSVRNGLTALEERYGGITENPTFGDEDPVPRAETAASFRSVAILLFLVLGIGTGLAAVGLGIATLAIGLSIVVGGRAEGGCLSAVLVGAAAGPLGIAVATIIGWTLGERVRHLALAPRCDRGGAELDALTRRGLFTEIKGALGATWLEVARNPDTEQITGAALVEARRGRFVLILDPKALAIVRETSQREALVWHEVGHVRAAETMAVRWRVLFNLWHEHAARVLLDSLEQELRADRYAVARMGSPAALDGGLAALAPHLQEPVAPVATRGWNVGMAVRLLLGAPRVGYLYPHVGVRRQVLAALAQGDGGARGQPPPGSPVSLKAAQ